MLKTENDNNDDEENSYDENILIMMISTIAIIMIIIMIVTITIIKYHISNINNDHNIPLKHLTFSHTLSILYSFL